MSVTEVRHPLVQHKLSYLRDKNTPTVHFRRLVEEVTLLLTYEATKDLPTADVDVETPLEVHAVPAHPGQEGRRLPDPARRDRDARRGAVLIPGARVGFIGLYRNEETLRAGRVLREAPVRRR